MGDPIVMKSNPSIFKVGETILFRDSGAKNQDPFSGIILEVKGRIKISYFDPPEQKVIWVDPETLEKPDSFRCAHNAECGLCDDSGKCLYE
jgi:hypothetical protein